MEVPKCLHQEGGVHGLQISDPNLTHIFGAAQMFLVDKVMETIGKFFPPPKKTSTDFINQIKNTSWQREG